MCYSKLDNICVLWNNYVSPIYASYILAIFTNGALIGAYIIYSVFDPSSPMETIGTFGIIFLLLMYLAIGLLVCYGCILNCFEVLLAFEAIRKYFISLIFR